MRAADDSERQASFSTNRITAGFPDFENFAAPSDPETSGSDADFSTSGTSSETAFDPGNESCVIDTDVELECTSRHIFTQEEVRSLYSFRFVAAFDCYNTQLVHNRNQIGMLMISKSVSRKLAPLS